MKVLDEFDQVIDGLEVVFVKDGKRVDGIQEDSPSGPMQYDLVKVAYGRPCHNPDLLVRIGFKWDKQKRRWVR